MSANNNFETFKHIAGPPDGVTPVKDNLPLFLRLVFKILNTFGREGSQSSGFLVTSRYSVPTLKLSGKMKIIIRLKSI